MEKKWLFILICCFVPILLWSQQAVTITGLVVDEQNNPVIGATIMEKGTQNGTITALDGTYSINVNAGSVMIITYIGYVTQEIPVGSNTVVNVVLQDDSKILEEVVVVGYGVAKKATLTGAISQISDQDIISTKSVNTINSVQGKIPGLMIRQRSGAPGSDAFLMNVRGYDAAPLLVIDGVARPNMNLNNINPNDIESISLLKDASASIYGINADGGVIIVTTKQGKTGKTKVDYSGYYGIKSPTGMPKTVDSYTLRLMENEMSQNWGGNIIYTDDELQKWKEGNLPGYGDYNWMDKILKNYTSEQQHSLSARGGTDKLSYYLSFGYQNEDGLLASDIQNSSKYDFRASLNAELYKGLRTNVNFMTQHRDVKGPRLDFIWIYKQILFADRSYEPLVPGTDHITKVEGAEYNPYALMHEDIDGYTKNKNTSYQATMDITYDFPYLQGLQMKVLGALDYYVYNYSNLQKGYDSYNFKTGEIDKTVPAAIPSYTNQYNITRVMDLQAQLLYSNRFNNVHGVSGTLVGELLKGDGDYLRGTTKYPDIFIGDFIDLGKETESRAYGNRGRDRKLSLLGRFNYNYMEKYMAELTFRYDGTYKYAYGKRWVLSPAASLGWRVSEENFMKNIESISNLKIRGSYGMMARDAGDAYQWYEGYRMLGSGLGYVFDSGSLTPGLSFPAIINPNHTWVKTYTGNVGFDLSLLENKYFVTFDVFQKESKGELARRASDTPNTFGGEMPLENLNSTRIRGLEIEIGHTNKIDDFSYRVSANMTYSRKQFIKVERPAYNSSMERWRDMWAEGRYIGARWGFEDMGQYTHISQFETAPLIDRNGRYGNSKGRPGTAIIKDANGDGRIDENDMLPIYWNGQIDLGNGAFAETNPPLQYGMTLGMQWKNVDLTMVLQGASLFTIYTNNWDVWGYARTFGRGTLYDFYMDRWHTKDPNADRLDPNTEWVSGYWNALMSDPAGTTDDLPTSKFILNANYLRLKSLEIGYSFSPKWLSAIKSENVRIYFNAFNLLTFCNEHVRHLDPEKAEGDYQANLTYPLMKSFNFGINLSF